MHAQIFVVVFVTLETPHGLPLPSGEGIGDTVTNTSSQLPMQYNNDSVSKFNCSDSNVSHNAYVDDMLQLSIGMYVLKQYSSTVYRNRNSKYPTSVDCSSPVEYTGIYYPSKAAQVQDIASWSSVFQSFTTYLETRLPQTAVEGDANVLGNITALLNSVLGEYTDVVC